MEVKSNKLIINNKEIEFENTINKVLEVEDIIIVYLFSSREMNPKNKQPFNNVYAVDINGNVLWNIKEIFEKTKYKGERVVIDIGLNEKNNLILNDHIGAYYEININKKEIVETSVRRWWNSNKKEYVDGSFWHDRTDLMG